MPVFCFVLLPQKTIFNETLSSNNRVRLYFDNIFFCILFISNRTMAMMRYIDGYLEINSCSCLLISIFLSLEFQFQSSTSCLHNMILQITHDYGIIMDKDGNDDDDDDDEEEEKDEKKKEKNHQRAGTWLVAVFLLDQLIVTIAPLLF